MRFSTMFFGGLLLLIGYGTGCKKYVQIDPPESMITVGTVFSNDSMARDALRGLYYKIMNGNQSLLNGGLSIYPALSADELKSNTLKTDDDQFFKNALLPDNSIINTNFWRAGYTIIYFANICIENLSQSGALSSDVKKQLTGEAKFIRALCYMYLVNLFGEVPLVTSTDVDVNAALPRSPQSKVHELIINDLMQAWLTLSEKGATPTSPDQYAAASLLAREYCYLQDWEQAATFSSVVINSGKFKLETDLNNVFVTKSAEAVFSLAPVGTNNSTSEGFAFVPGSTAVVPPYSLTDSLLVAFEPNDLRKTYWTKSQLINGKTYWYPYKYKIRMGANNPPGEYNVVLRLAEQYLIRAEARARQNSLTSAQEDLNLIRNRAGLTPLSALDLDQCLTAINQQRRIEFFCEWGHRWFDLKGTNELDAVLTRHSEKTWQTTDRFYPIPFQEMQRNPNLNQNEGY